MSQDAPPLPPAASRPFAGLRGQIGASRGPLPGFIAIGVVWGSFSALVPDLKAGLAINDATLGLVLLAASCAAVCTMLLAPRIGAGLGAAALPLVTVALGLVYLLPAQMPLVWLFALAMMLVAGCGALLDVLVNARLSGIEASRGLHLMNLNHAAYSFAYAIAAVATGLARNAGLSPGPVMAAAAVVVVMLAAATLQRDGGIKGLRPAPGATRRLGPVPFWAGVVILIAFLAENATESWSALHIERTLGGSPAEGALGPALMALTMGLGRLAGQAVAARVAERRLLRAALTVSVAGTAVVAVAPLPWVAYLGFVVLGLGVSVVAPTAFALVGRLVPPDRRARAIARAALLGYLGFFFGPPVLGLVSQLAGLRAAFGLVAVVLAAGVLLVSVLGRHDTAGR